ncbi:type II secretion system protein [Geomonas sp. RF6]|uniref:tetratricopeptide repeat protein n=1 Tax=Geomonas sp. RF6 TaxID=2897342 RepID=UPI001E5F78EA|nr:tetratricopeptide repeat protein [Geomonas sp. RF6]UFS70869.1 type II secretion system protein [Geomonas sp. RF6]
MHHMKSITLGLLAALALSGCAGGKSAFSKAEKLEKDGNLDEAVVKYAEVASQHPEVGEYRVRFLHASEKAAEAHFKKGEALFAAKNYEGALREYQTAGAIDPSFGQARQQADRALKLRNAQTYFNEGVEFEKNRKPREALNSYRHALEFDPAGKEIKEALERLVQTKRPKLDGFDLNLKSTKPITLKFKDAKLKEIFSILTQLSGINFIFDDTVKDVNVSLFLENATFQQAMEIICGVNKLGKKVLNESTIIVYPKTPDKNKQYEELVVQTFYLNKLDAKKAVNLIRTMLTVKKIYVNEEMNALVIRDTPDVIDVARRIIEANDVPDAEVLLEVEVFEIAKKNEEAFGLALSRYAVSAVATNPNGQVMVDSLSSSSSSTSNGGTSSTVGPQNLLNFFSYQGYNGYLTVPNATFNFGKTLANGETLSNPKIRVKNREKAKFNVGTRVPITTTSSPSGGGVSVNVQYVDVGVKVNAEPTIQLNNEVSIKLGLEVSSILQRDTVGTDQATTVVTIGTRNLDTVLSLKDGETSIIGGLIQNIKNDSKDKISFLGDIPLIGSLLTNTNKSNDKTELMLAITPRIVRAVTVPEGDVASFWSGREDDPSSNKPYASFVQEPELPAAPEAAETAAAPAKRPAARGGQAAPAPAAAAAPQGAPAAAPAPPAPAPGQPVQPVQPVQAAQQPAIQQPAIQQPPAAPPVAPQPAAPATAQPAVAAQAPASAPGAAGQGAGKIFLNLQAPASVRAKENFTVQVSETGAKNLANVVFTVVYDPKLLEVVEQREGTLLKSGGATNFQAYPDKKRGEVWVSLSRAGAGPGVEGAGQIASFTFKALAKGGASIGLANANFTTPTGDRIEVVPFNSVVEVQ